MTGIHLLVPGRNVQQDWAERALLSIDEQTRLPDSVLVIDDASDRPGYVGWLASSCTERGWGFLHNRLRYCCPYNLKLGTRLLAIPATDVVVILDMDDFLAPIAIERIATAYEDDNIWTTYGNFAPHPHNTGQRPAASYSYTVIRDRTFRRAGNLFDHPLTFRRFLFDAVTDKELHDNEGKWFQGGYDFTIMSPMLEMATPTDGSPLHWTFISDVLYYYNAVNPHSEVSTMMPYVHKSRQIMDRPPREPLVR